MEESRSGGSMIEVEFVDMYEQEESMRATMAAVPRPGDFVQKSGAHYRVITVDWLIDEGRVRCSLQRVRS